MNPNDKLNAILHIRPNAEFVLRELDLEWLDTKQSEPTEIEIEAGLIAFQIKVEADKSKTAIKKEAAEAKLIALGLTIDDLQVLGLS